MKKYNRCIKLLQSALVLSVITGFLSAIPVSAGKPMPRCLYISSYHSGYAWSDGVEEGVRSALQSKCEIRQFDMDTKRKRSKQDIQNAVNSSIKIIESWKPDVVITSDDNAAKYLIVPHYMNHEIPFVFSGINWTVEEYGFPVSNVTGIVEIAPIEPMLREALRLSDGRTGVYLGADTLTEQKNYKRIQAGATKLGSTLKSKLVQNAQQWKEEFEKANKTADYIVMGSNSGIANWDDDEIASYVMEHAAVVSVTNHRWMMPVTALGYTKIPQEHGEWAARAALEILAGSEAIDIPVVTNRKWDMWINQGVVNSTAIELSSKFTRRAKKFVSIAE